MSTTIEQHGETRTPGYEVIENLTETPVKYFSTSTPPMRDVGDAAVYYDEIFDAAGKVVGHTVGYAIVHERRESDGHLVVSYDETLRIEGGTLHATGTFDRDVLLNGGKGRLHLVGTSGRFLGRAGIREWWLTAPLPNETVALRMILCG